MENEIRVCVVKLQSREKLIMQYRDPLTGLIVRRTTKTTDYNEATKAAGQWQAELREGRYQSPSRVTWEHFREQYEAEKLPSLKATTQAKSDIVLDSFENTIKPLRLESVNAALVSRWQAELRSRKLSEQTIAGYSAHLKAALRWAVDVGLMRAAPKIQKPVRAKGSKFMKGRPITTEEFERMIAAVPKALNQATRRKPTPTRKPAPIKPPAELSPHIVESWRFLLYGLWHSGLRLGESTELYWDRDDKLRVELGTRRPMFQIRAELEKGNQDRLLPMAPEFAEFLESVPVDERTGPVFRPLGNRGQPVSLWWVSQVVAAIGRKAGIKVDVSARTGETIFASAHDLRRSFGQRWSSRVMPQVLMQMMRHESMDTTLKFYVGRDAEQTADVMWQAHAASKRAAEVQSEVHRPGKHSNPKPSTPVTPKKDGTSEVDRAGIEPATHGFSVRSEPNVRVPLHSPKPQKDPFE